MVIFNGFRLKENCFLTVKCVLFAYLLGSVKMIVFRSISHQFVVRSKLFHTPIFQEQDMVNKAYRAESVSDYDARILLNIRKKSFLEKQFGFVVEGGSGLVKDENRRFF